MSATRYTLDDAFTRDLFDWRIQSASDFQRGNTHFNSRALQDLVIYYYYYCGVVNCCCTIYVYDYYDKDIELNLTCNGFPFQIGLKTERRGKLWNRI